MGGSASTPTTPTCRSSRASTAPTRWSRCSARLPTRSTRSTPSASGTRPWSRPRAASTPTFTAFRGFEWTSDRFGHINVYFSQHDTNAKADGGYATMDGFYSWLTRAPALGGGADGIATFNHPGAKSLSGSDPGFNWNNFAYVPAADDQMVGIEVFNDSDDFGAAAYRDVRTRSTRAGTSGAVGAEDLGHKRTDDWGGPGWAKTVILANGRSRGADRGGDARAALLRGPHTRRAARLHRRRRGRWARASRAAEGAGPAGAGERQRPARPSSSWSPASARWWRSGTGSLVARPVRDARRALVLRAGQAGRQDDRLLEPGVGGGPAGARRRGQRVAGGRPARPHLLLARRLVPAQRRQHRAGRVLHRRHEHRDALPRSERARPRLPRDHRPQRHALRRATPTSAPTA